MLYGKLIQRWRVRVTVLEWPGLPNSKGRTTKPWGSVSDGINVSYLEPSYYGRPWWGRFTGLVSAASIGLAWLTPDSQRRKLCYRPAQIDWQQRKIYIVNLCISTTINQLGRTKFFRSLSSHWRATSAVRPANFSLPLLTRLNSRKLGAQRRLCLYKTLQRMLLRKSSGQSVLPEVSRSWMISYSSRVWLRINEEYFVYYIIFGRNNNVHHFLKKEGAAKKRRGSGIIDQDQGIGTCGLQVQVSRHHQLCNWLVSQISPVIWNRP